MNGARRDGHGGGHVEFVDAPKSRDVTYAPWALGNAETWTQEGQQTIVSACIYIYLYTCIIYRYTYIESVCE